MFELLINNCFKFLCLMKKIFMLLAFMCLLTVSCKDKKTEEVVVPEPKQEVYQPMHLNQTISYDATKTYNYFEAPNSVAAKEVTVNYDKREPYTKPIEVVYVYPKGDTFTYVLENFGIWTNENGMYRVIVDKNCTVWIQGQTKCGKFKEFVFYGNPKYNGTKISPNSYINLPDGYIKYRK